MPLDHIALYVPQGKVEEMVTWLTSAGEPLGFREFFRPMPNLVAMGEEKPWFWVSGDAKLDEAPKLDDSPDGWRHPHLGFVANDAETVGKWHAAAIKAGGTDNGAPGPRPMFGPTYYAAFVKDPVLGINFEAVCKTYLPPSDDAKGDKEGKEEKEKEKEKREAVDESTPTKGKKAAQTKHESDEATIEVDEQPGPKRARRAT